jgi:hypothetical protein
MLMAERTSTTSSELDSGYKTSAQRILALPKISKPPKLWLWIISLLIIGLIILGSVSFITWKWVSNLQVSLGATSTQPTITTFSVQRSITYADLTITVLNAQYATSFPDDTIQSGPAVVRLNMGVINKTTDPVFVIYYDVARLLVPKLNPVAPSNLHLSTGPKPGSSETGWIDFPVARGIQLATLKLQLGSAALGETLVTIPFSGAFDPKRYVGRTSHQSLAFLYDFAGNTLIYHLNSVDIRYSYRGTECKVGQQFYVLNFSVDNNNGVAVSPGYGFNYIRLVVKGYNQPPYDNTLPYDFKAGAHGIAGRVVYTAPAGLKTLTIVFLLQEVEGQENFDVRL